MSAVGTRNEADRLVWIESALRAVPPGARLLDAGAGEQRLRSLCSHLQYVAQDFAQYDGRGDGSGLQVGMWDQSRLDIVSDITSIPEPDASFDAVLCVEVLEHVPQPLLALKEFSRLLRPGGQLILTAPFCSLTHFAPYHFYSGFSRYFYETHLKAHGFDLVELSSNGNFFEFLAQELRRSGEVARRYSRSRPRISERIAIRLVLSMLRRFSTSGEASAELLHFGHHVRAVRRSD